MSKIEETLGVVSNLAAATFDVDETDALLDAVRDHALAVLERAALLGGDRGVEVTAEYQALRKEIEALP